MNRIPSCSGISREDIEEAFNKVDSSGTGFVSIKRLKMVMRIMRLEPRQCEVDLLVKKMLSNEAARSVNQDEFSFEELVFVLEDKIRDNETDLGSVFRLFDTGGKGFISVSDLRRISKELGENLNDAELEEMIDGADFSRTGKVTESDFNKIMRKTGLY